MKNASKMTDEEITQYEYKNLIANNRVRNSIFIQNLLYEIENVSDIPGAADNALECLEGLIEHLGIHRRLHMFKIKANNRRLKLKIKILKINSDSYKKQLNILCRAMGIPEAK